MKSAYEKKALILKSAISISDVIGEDDGRFLNDEELSFLLKLDLVGISTEGLPNRTRSKVVKSAICQALGYSVPKSFKKTQPRFLGQNFDTYVQKSMNLQIWNEDVAPNRRYILIQISETDVIINVRVINGAELAKLDTTGTLTQKYQARMGALVSKPDVFSATDTTNLQKLITAKRIDLTKVAPSADPSRNTLLPIAEIETRLTPIIGTEFLDAGRNQDRNRSAIIHSLVCAHLGYPSAEENGQFPDVLNQLLEVKLQMSPTVDLGLVIPNSDVIFLKVEDVAIRHCDVRYVVFEAIQVGSKIRITNFALGTGNDFLSKFTLFAGNVLNKKIQITLPKNFFKT